MLSYLFFSDRLIMKNMQNLVSHLNWPCIKQYLCVFFCFFSPSLSVPTPFTPSSYLGRHYGISSTAKQHLQPLRQRSYEKYSTTWVPYTYPIAYMVYIILSISSYSGILKYRGVVNTTAYVLDSSMYMWYFWYIHCVPTHVYLRPNINLDTNQQILYSSHPPHPTKKVLNEK